ncbi:MAG TPA: sulfotransferase [Croceibacterium sp.]|nr:sulfotransferase [Croceibacterium sp.]
MTGARAAPPDFAIVGAPKCGTTALYSYLATHPGIAMAARKEPGFWCTDAEAPWRVTDRAAYDALWAGAAPGAVRGEATPVYLQSAVAIPRLLAARPDARLIAMIRNPLEMAASRHADLLFGPNEDVAEFEAAWRLQERRRNGEDLPPGCREPAVLQYLANAAIGDQLERFVALVPPAQRLVIVYDDLRRDPGGEYRRVLEWLGLPDDGRGDFAPVHARRALRWAGLAGWQRALARRVGWLYRPARALAHAAGISPAALNVRPAPRRPLRAEFEAELIAAFAPQVDKAARLLGRDLAAWRTPASTIRSR